MSARFTCSRPDNWTLPKRPMTDADRQHFYGKILPMEYERPSLWKRIFGRG